MYSIVIRYLFMFAGQRLQFFDFAIVYYTFLAILSIESWMNNITECVSDCVCLCVCGHVCAHFMSINAFSTTLIIIY